MKLAYVSPVAPIRSGIADYSDELLPCLADHFAIDVYVDGNVPSAPATTEPFRRLCADELIANRSSYDAVIYQIGNSPVHAAAFRLLPRLPGITVLHDFILHHAIVELTIGRGDEFAYVREMGYCGGVAGATAARRALRNGHQYPFSDYPLNQRVLDASLGVIVHSRYVRDLVTGLVPDTPVTVIPHHVLPESESCDPADARSFWGWEPSSLLFGSFGLATPSKRLDVALRAFSRVRERFPDAHFVIVGSVVPDFPLAAIVGDLSLQSSVTVTGYVDKSTLVRYIRAVDIGVSLRWPTMGETSGSLMRLLAAGKPTLVSNVGAFAEFPDDCVWKVPVGEGEEASLFQAMLSLAGEREARLAVGDRARSYVRQHHSIERSAAAYAAFIRQIVE